MNSNRVPKTNNAGEIRLPKTPESIADLDNYKFKSSILRAAIGKKRLQKIVAKYLEVRRGQRSIIYRPSKSEWAAFTKYDTMKITYDELEKRLGTSSTFTTKAKIGRLYVYKKERERAHKDQRISKKTR